MRFHLRGAGGGDVQGRIVSSISFAASNPAGWSKLTADSGCGVEPKWGTRELLVQMGFVVPNWVAPGASGFIEATGLVHDVSPVSLK